jgi:Ca2+-binding RTX toxin-like protein
MRPPLRACTAAAAAALAVPMLVVLAGPAHAGVVCLGQTVTIFGDDNANNLIGGDGNDVIWAAGGHDTVDGGGGNDYLGGGDRDDTLIGGTGHNVIAPGAGSDTVTGNPAGGDALSYADSATAVEAFLDIGMAYTNSET